MTNNPGSEGRAIVGDVETTGLDVDDGDKIVEIGMIEIFNMIPTGRRLHLHINPERDIPDEVVKIHGITNERVANCPTFPEVAQQVSDFIGGAKTIFHNAPFDTKFINTEFVMAGRQDLIIPDHAIVDSLKIFKDSHPTSPGSLDALCRRFGIDNSKRELHGALLDSEILADVWLALNGGAQISLVMDQQHVSVRRGGYGAARQRTTPLPSLASHEDHQRHAEWLEKSGIAPALWSAMIAAEPEMYPESEMEGP